MKLRYAALTACALPLLASAQTKPLFLFEIDEGFKDSLLGRFRNDPAGMETALKNIRSGLIPLTKKYDVAVLLYPCQAYRAEGSGLDRVEPALKQVFEFFERPEPGQSTIGVYLEAMSSGIASEQDGALDRRPIPFLGVGPNDHPRLGLSMDVVTFGALRDAYPKAFRGLRFHEVYGSDAAWKVRPEGQKWGFVTDPEVIRGCVDLCAQKGMRLVWSDSNWLLKYPPTTGEPNYLYSKQYRPYVESSPFTSLQDEAEAKLGDRLCFSWANNNYHLTPCLEYLNAKIGPSAPGVARPIPEWLYFDEPYRQFALKGRPKARWGMSIQSWFWHEMTNTLTGRYYFTGELACPVEVLVAYSKKGIREGASVLQFEPSWYFFNEEMPGNTKTRSSYEKKPDYSPRVALSRLTEALLAPEKSGVPDRLEPIFDPDQQRFHENDAKAPPRNYAETTVNLLAKVSATAFASYSFAPKWKRQSIDQWPAATFAPNAKFVRRCEIDGDGVDEVLVLGPQKVEFLTQNGSPMEVDFPNLRDVVGITTANLVQNVIGPGDPDEIVVAFDKGARLSLQVYIREADKGFVKLDPARNRSVLLASLGMDTLDAKTFVGLAGLRRDARIYDNGARSLDTLAAIVRGPKQIQARFKSGLVALPGIPINARQIDVCPVDDAFSGRDSLFFSWRQPGKSDLLSAIYRPNGARVTQAVFPPPAGRTATSVFALRKRILLNGGKPHG